MSNCLTVKEASKVFFKGLVSEGLLYKLAKQKKIPHVRLSNGKILFDSAALEKWWETELSKSIEKTEEEQTESKSPKGYGTLRVVEA